MTMPVPPFKLAETRGAASVPPHRHAAPDPPTVERTVAGRRRLADLDGHLHCSVIGTCLGTAELRRLMSRHYDVHDADDLEVHHEAVRLVAERGPLAKTLQKALDQKHAGAITTAARLRGVAALEGFWKESLRIGEVPGAYWAALTHRDTDSELIRKIFGDVHMLSHLVGSSNRADLRRLFALEEAAAAQQRQADASHARFVKTLADRDREVAVLTEMLAATPRHERSDDDAQATIAKLTSALREAVAEAALLRERGARHERSAAEAQAEADGLRAEVVTLRFAVAELEHELESGEAHLARTDASAGPSIADQIRGRRILYVGGRPGAIHAIRDLVVRHGGDFRSHDGGLEDRKGLLAPAVVASDVVVFPVDCINHDSAGNIKRLCARSNVRYIPLRSAGVASFAAAFADARVAQAQGS